MTRRDRQHRIRRAQRWLRSSRTPNKRAAPRHIGEMLGDRYEEVRVGGPPKKPRYALKRVIDLDRRVKLVPEWRDW